MSVFLSYSSGETHYHWGSVQTLYLDVNKFWNNSDFLLF